MPPDLLRLESLLPPQDFARLLALTHQGARWPFGPGGDVDTLLLEASEEDVDLLMEVARLLEMDPDLPDSLAQEEVLIFPIDVPFRDAFLRALRQNGFLAEVRSGELRIRVRGSSEEDLLRQVRFLQELWHSVEAIEKGRLRGHRPGI